MVPKAILQSNLIVLEMHCLFVLLSLVNSEVNLRNRFAWGTELGDTACGKQLHK